MTDDQVIQQCLNHPDDLVYLGVQTGRPGIRSTYRIPEMIPSTKHGPYYANPNKEGDDQWTNGWHGNAVGWHYAVKRNSELHKKLELMGIIPEVTRQPLPKPKKTFADDLFHQL